GIFVDSDEIAANRTFHPAAPGCAGVYPVHTAPLYFPQSRLPQPRDGVGPSMSVSGGICMTQLFSKNDKSGLTRDLIEALFPMFEQASAGGIAVDRQARITWINASYASLLGIEDPAAVIGEPVRRV